MQKTIILGSGGHAKVIIEILRAAGLYEPVGCVAPGADGGGALLGVPILGDDNALPELREQGIRYAMVALGDNHLRQRLMQYVVGLGFELANAVSPAATIAASTRLGVGLAIMPGANVGPETVIEDGVIINSRASVDHDGALGYCCHIGPGATLAGCVSVGARAFVATGASVIPEIRIGEGSVIGAGSVVVRDVPAHVVAYGCPARCRRALEPTASPPQVVDGSSGTATSAPPLRLVS